MINKTLNQLANDNATGAIDKEKYRTSRGELIKGIVSGQIAVDTIDYLPPLDMEEDPAVTEPAARERDTTEIVTPPPAAGKASPAPSPRKASSATSARPVPAQTKSFPWAFVLISTAIVILLIIAVVMFYPKPPGAKTETIVATTKQTTSTANTDPTSKAGEDLIGSFLSNKSWTKESMGAFTDSWNALSVDERAATAKTKRMQRFSSTIYKQFLEEKALASIDMDKSRQRQQSLIDFAQSIGIEDARMVIE